MKLHLLFKGLLLCFLFGCANSHQKTDLTIACAANLQYAINEIKEQFEKQHNISCQLIISSSGKLTAQIKEGAPYDVFISADMKYPELLYQNGLANIPPKTYAYGKLVLWTNKITDDFSINSMTSDQINYIAIANPETAPYGKAALEALKYHQQFDLLKDKLVFGESVSQINQFIISQSADVGFTAKSIVLSPALRDKGKWVELDSASYQPIEQGILLIDRGESQNTAARDFYDYIFSPEAKKNLMNYGYSINE
ncbi:MAG: molybdate ABC transporter substrate-binding protein [Bacteroidota bacterium]